MMDDLQERYNFMITGLERIKSDFSVDEQSSEAKQLMKSCIKTPEEKTSEMEISSQYELLSNFEKARSFSKAISRPRRHGAQKDSLEYATSWTRAFYDIYEKTLWLKSYCKINELATTK